MDTEKKGKVRLADNVTDKEVLRRLNEDKQILNLFVKGNINGLHMF